MLNCILDGRQSSDNTLVVCDGSSIKRNVKVCRKSRRLAGEKRRERSQRVKICAPTRMKTRLPARSRSVMASLEVRDMANRAKRVQRDKVVGRERGVRRGRAGERK